MQSGRDSGRRLGANFENAMSEPIQLTWAQMCARYIQLHSQIAVAEKEIKKYGLTDKIKAGLLAGKTSPPDLPFLLEARTSQRPERDYKRPLMAVLRKFLGRSRAIAALARIESRFKIKTVYSLTVSVNHDFALMKVERN